MNFLVLGAGAQGSAAAFDLLRRDAVDRVVLADLEVDDLAPFLEPYLGGRLEAHSVNASRPDDVRTVMAGVDAVACALPYFFNLPMSELALDAGAHFCDLGGNTEIVQEQKRLNARAQAHGLSVIPDCGLAPGMVNVLAQDAIEGLDRTDRLAIRVGGLPRHPVPPLNYQIVYSMEGVLDYYTTEALAIEDGRVVHKEPLSGIESVCFPEPVGELEAFYTAGGASTLPLRYEGKIRELNYKTLRYPGHAALMGGIRALGLLNLDPVDVDGHPVVPRRAFIEIVSPKLRNPQGDDMVVLRVEAEGWIDERAAVVRYELIDYYDAQRGISAMERTTGYSLGITALMQADGRIKEVGVCTPDECVPASAYLAELRESGIEVKRTVLR
jgi:lysine 6-dehydrogenase